MEKTGKLPVSEHFELQQVADGVYAAIARPDGAAVSNASIADLGDQTLIFDTFESPEAASDLRAAARHLTGRETTYVIISHSHSDHWGGNQVFAPQIPIITAHGILEEMPSAVGWLQELKEDPAQLMEAIQEEQERLEAETDPRWRISRERAIARMSGWLATLPNRQFRLPSQTFGGKLIFHGKRRTAELHEVAPGHTNCDVYLILPADRIALLGDLGFFHCQPFMVYCDAQAWVAHLEEMERSEIEAFVPGHGGLGTKEDLVLQRQYITLLEELVAQAIKEGLSPEETLQKPLPAPFDGWLEGSMARWEANVWSTHERLSGGSGGQKP